MPAFSGYMTWYYASGLALYWSVGNLIGIAQQAVMNRTSLGREMREIAAKRARRKTKAKKQTIRPRAKRTAPKKTGPRPTEPPRQPAGATEEAVIVDIIEEPAPGVVVVTEFASVQTTTPLPKGSKGFSLDGAEEDGGD